MVFLLLVILAHVVADFLLQTQAIIAKKEKRLPGGYIFHGLIHLGVLLVLTHFYFCPDLLIFYVTLVVLHIFIDITKDCLLGRQQVTMLIVDQILHLVVIFMCWQWFAMFDLNPGIQHFYSQMLSTRGVDFFRVLCGDINPSTALVTVIVYLYVLMGGAVLIRQVLSLESLALPPERYGKEDRQAGRYIGMLERAIILTLTLTGAFTSIAFILTAKSIARYKELENKDFAEYYLIGTLLSTLLAVLGGVFLLWLRRQVL